MVMRISQPAFTAVVLAALMALQSPPSRAEHELAGPMTAREMVGIKGLAEISISPDGKFVAVQVDNQDLAANTTVLDWYIVPVAGGQALRVASGGDPRFATSGDFRGERAQWSSDGRWIYYTALKGEDVQVWRARRDGSKVEQVTHDAADVIAFEVTAEGAVIYSAAGATRAEIKKAESEAYDEGVLIDQTVIPSFPLFRNFPYNGRMATMRVPKPNSYFKMTLLGDRPVRFMKQTPGAKKPTPAPAEAIKRYERNWYEGSGRFGNSGGGRFLPPSAISKTDATGVAAPGGDRTAHLTTSEDFARGDARKKSGQDFSWRQGDKEQAICTLPACTEADRLILLGWLADASGIVFQTVAQGQEAVRVWDVGANEVRTLAELDGSLGGVWSGRFGACELGRDAIVCIAAAPDLPPRLIAIDLHTGRQTLLIDPNPTLTPARLARTETILLHDSWGAEAWARLFLPRDWSPADGRLPVVLTSYSCGGFPLGGSGEDVPEQDLAGRGFAALCVDSNAWNVRRPASFADGPDDLDRSTIELFEDAIRVLDARGIIDRDRVAVAGFSGSATAVAYGIAHSEAFTAAIITTTSGGDSISCYLNAQTGNCRRYGKMLGDQPPYDGRASFSKNGAALNASSIVTPLMMQLADVESQGMMQLYGALGDFDRAYEMRVYPEEFHIKRQPRHRLSTYERNIDWIEFWLRGREVSAATQGPQYVRWRKMRDGQCAMFAARAAGSKTPWYCRASALKSKE
ncbi:MAG: Atxe2 family lasso peptide isopeptidase [Hyphomonadaceae bacterium]